MTEFKNKTGQAEAKNAVLYLRVSTEEQVDNYSLGTQEEICTNEAKRKGYEILRIYREEGKSAKTIKGRPVLLEMLEFCRLHRKTVDAVIVYRIDRISRQTLDFLNIRLKLSNYNIKLISTSEPIGNSPAERFMEKIFASSAEFENDIRSERAKNGLRARFLSGLTNATPPFGYKNESGYAVKDFKSWDKIKKAWEIMATGSKSLSEMAKCMNEWGLKQNFKNQEYPIRAAALNKTFRNKFYMGILTSKKYTEEVRGQHVPMITEELFNKVQSVLDGRNTHKVSLRKTRDNPDFPLRRFIKCGICGYGLTGGWSKGRCKKYPYYKCIGRCTKSVPRANLEESTITFLNNIRFTPQGLEFFKKILFKKHAQRIAVMRKLHSDADRTINKQKELKQILIEKNLTGFYSDDIFKEQSEKIDNKIKEALLLQNDSLIIQYDKEVIEENITKKLFSLGNIYQIFTLTQKRLLLSLIFNTPPKWNYPGLSEIKLNQYFFMNNH